MKSIYALVSLVSLWCLTLLAYEDPIHVKFAHQVMCKHVQEMSKRGFSLVVIGGAMMDDISSLSFKFHSRTHSTIDEARIMYVNGMQRILAEVNRDEAIRLYLREHPFGIRNIRYGISFPDVPIDAAGQGPIVYMFGGREGEICYCRYDKSRESTNPLVIVHCEPYADALRIVREAGALDDLTQR